MTDQIRQLTYAACFEGISTPARARTRCIGERGKGIALAAEQSNSKLRVIVMQECVHFDLPVSGQPAPPCSA
jgi:hypothetical protein